MALHPCRKDRHNYEALAGTVAGLGRRTCSTCGSVQIDIRDTTDEVGTPAYVFSERRPTLFSLRTEGSPEESENVSSWITGRGPGPGRGRCWLTVAVVAFMEDAAETPENGTRGADIGGGL